MWFFQSNRKRPSISRQDSLAGVPVLNPGVRLSEQEDGRLVVSVTLRRKPGGFLSRFQPPVTKRRIKLDELGSFVVRQVDGKKSILRIIEQFVSRFGANRREAELSTVEFFKSLAKRRVVSIIIK